MKIKSNRKKRFAILRLSAIIFALLSLIGLYIGGTKQTYADGVSLSEVDIKAYEQNIFYKVEFNNLKRCYSKLATTIEKNIVNKISDALTSETTNSLNYPFFITGPSYWNDSTHRSCEELLRDQSISEFLTSSSGFYPMEESDESRRSGKKCFYISANPNNELNSKTYRTGDYCVETDSSGNIKEDTIEYLLGANSGDGGSLANNTNSFLLIGKAVNYISSVSIPKNKNGQLCFDVTYLRAGEIKASKFEGDITFEDENMQCKELPMSYDSFKDFVGSIVKNSIFNDSSKKRVFIEKTVSITDSTTDKGIKKFTTGDDSAADKFANKFLKITKGIDIKDGKFSDAEKYIMYRNALKSFYEVDFDYNDNGNKAVSWLADKTYTFTDNVYLKPTARTSEKILVPYSSYDTLGRANSDGEFIYYWSDYELGAGDIITEMSKINVAEAFKEKPTALINPDSGSNDGSNSESDICYSAGGALSWILCPIINAAHSAIDGIYNTLEGWIRINSGIVEKLGSTDDSGDNSLFKAWSTFRNIANIAFVILFMAIIFSQLTGYGIDNYGIKRMLPKLIITAILVNLSYIICGLLVDISNIVGNSVKGLFEGMAVNKGILGDTSINAPSALVKAILGVGVGVGAIGVFVLSGANFLPIVLFVITMLIGALTILIILGMRQALVIVLIMASPLAMVCMILPNTEGIYKKWKDAFKGMLIVYPIISAVIGASYFAASIIATTENGGITAIIAGILMIAPYFMIPSLTRKSIDAIGNIGSRISSFGQRGSGRAQNGVRSSNLGKSMQQNADLRRAKRVEKRLQNQYNRRGKLSDKKLEKLRSAQDTILADSKRQSENNIRVKSGNYLEAMGRSLEEKERLEASKARTVLATYAHEDKGLQQLEKEWTEAFDKGDSNKLEALTNVMTQKFGPPGINSMVDKINNVKNMKENVNAQNSLKVLQGVMNDNRDFAGLMRSKAPDAYQMVADAGKRYDGEKMVYENMEWFTQHNETATAAKDWATTSSPTIKRAIENGALSERMITELLTSNDPAIKSGLQSEEKKLKLLQGALYNKTHGTNLELEEASKRYESENILYVSHEKDEDDAMRRGKVVIGKNSSGEEIVGYAKPANFNADNVPTLDANGDYVYIDKTTGAKWNVNTGRYISPNENGGGTQSSQPSSSTSTQAQPAQTQQTSQPQQSQQPTPTQIQQTSQPEPTQAQPQPVLQQTSQPQPQQSQQSTLTQAQPTPQQTSQPQQEQTDYKERLKEEIIQRNMNGEFSDETGEELLKMVDGSNNQNPNNS